MLLYFRLLGTTEFLICYIISKSQPSKCKHSFWAITTQSKLYFPGLGSCLGWYDNRQSAMFLCDSTDARRSVLALSGYWDEGVGAKWLAVLCLSRQISVALETRKVRIVSRRGVEAIHLVTSSSCFGSRWTSKIFWVNHPGRQARLCHIFLRTTALLLHSNVELSYISRGLSLLGDCQV